MKILFLFLLCAGMAVQGFAQCCSMGNPLSGMNYSGEAPKGQFQINTYFKSGYNETYFRHNVRLVNYGMYSHSGYDFAGLSLSYSLTNRLTIEHETGYYLRKEIRYVNPEIDALAKQGYGMSNGILSARYQLTGGKPGSARISAGGGVKYPYSTKMFSLENVDLPVELQPSTSGWGILGQVFISRDVSGVYKFLIGHRSEWNFRNKYDYLYGSMHTTTFALSGRIYRQLFGQAAIRNEHKLTDKTPTGAKLASQGGNTVIFAPKLGYQFPAGFHLAIFADVPVYKYYFGEQLSMQYAVGVSVSKSMSLAKKK